VLKTELKFGSKEMIDVLKEYQIWK